MAVGLRAAHLAGIYGYSGRVYALFSPEEGAFFMPAGSFASFAGYHLDRASICTALYGNDNHLIRSASGEKQITP